jgi:hypothetical protein
MNPYNKNIHNTMLAKWGQSLTKIFLTFEISDNDTFSYEVVDNKVNIISNGNDLSFELSALVKKFRVVIEYKNKVILEFIKSEPEEWLRLCNDKIKRTWLSIDWDHWILEEEDKQTNMMDPNMMNMMNMMNPNMMNMMNGDNDDEDKDGDGDGDEDKDGDGDEDKDGDDEDSEKEEKLELEPVPENESESEDEQNNNA